MINNEITVVLTGFGKFQGVADNPTTHLIAKLEEKYNKFPPTTHKAIFKVFPHVSVKQVTLDLEPIYDSLRRTDARNVVFVHLGVYQSCPFFRLETNAFNDATFRIPDEDDFQPTNQKINDNREFNDCIKSTLPLTELCASLKADGFDVQESDDAGRFLCNYVSERSERLHPLLN